LATFPEVLREDQRVPDNLAYLGELCKTPDAIIVKLPNVSASIPQLIECISELRGKGYDVPLYPAEPQNETEREIKKKYSTILGSAVNPVLREGNSDRRVAHMTHGDFYESEQSRILSQATDVAIELVPTSTGNPIIMKDNLALEKGEVIDAAFLSKKALCQFFEDEIEEAKETELLFSLVCIPII
jgi:isocitrate dehydrogenase